jgi:hypothetical protein
MNGNAGGLVKEIGRMLRERLGISVRIRGNSAGESGARLELSWEGSEQQYHVEAKDRVTSQDVDRLRDRSQGGATIVVAPTLTKQARERLRSGRINHADLAGNVYVRAPGLYLWLDADRKPRPLHGLRRERRVNPFSKRASLVLRAFLSNPEKEWRVRELSAETGLSLGHTSEVTASMVERGYISVTADRFLLKDPVGALHDWSNVYDWTSNSRQSFVAAYDHDELLSRATGELAGAKVSYALTLLAGAGMVAPHVRQHEQLHLYIGEADLQRSVAVVLQKLFAEPATRGGNLHLLLPYYRGAAFYDSQIVGGMSVASNVQLFLDLVAYPLRGAEAARAVAKGPLARQLKLDRAQVHALVEPLE